MREVVALARCARFAPPRLKCSGLVLIRFRPFRSLRSLTGRLSGLKFWGHSMYQPSFSSKILCLGGGKGVVSRASRRCAPLLPSRLRVSMPMFGGPDLPTVLLGSSVALRAPFTRLGRTFSVVATSSPLPSARLRLADWLRPDSSLRSLASSRASSSSLRSSSSTLAPAIAPSLVALVAGGHLRWG